MCSWDEPRLWNRTELQYATLTVLWLQAVSFSWRSAKARHIYQCVYSCYYARGLEPRTSGIQMKHRNTGWTSLFHYLTTLSSVRQNITQNWTECSSKTLKKAHINTHALSQHSLAEVKLNHRRSKSITTLLNIGARYGWVVNAMPRTFHPGKNTRYPLDWRLGGPQGRSEGVRKTLPPPGFHPRTVQPVASRYTHWAIPDSNILIKVFSDI